MDNPASLPQIKYPEVPADWNNGIGVEFARSLIKLLEGSQIVGGNLGQTNPFDVAVLQNSINLVNEKVSALAVKREKVVLEGVTNTEVIVPFPSFPDINYEINWNIIIAPGANPGPNVGVYIIDGTKQVDQFTVRFDGALEPFQVEFYMEQRKANIEEA